MASAVDICNEALSHLGDGATVSSIDPPEGSAQAEHCARFYHSSLASLLEMHPWSFTTRRASLAQLANPTTTWAYAYAVPLNTVNLLAVIASDATNDYSLEGSSSGEYTPQRFVVESNDQGEEIILTNQANAVARYTVFVADPAKFTPMFSETLGWFLASKLAGPVIMGDSGRKAAVSCMQTAMMWLGKAISSDSSSRSVDPGHKVAWISAR